jgi:hypothetical protein
MFHNIFSRHPTTINLQHHGKIHVPKRLLVPTLQQSTCTTMQQHDTPKIYKSKFFENLVFYQNNQPAPLQHYTAKRYTPKKLKPRILSQPPTTINQHQHGKHKSKQNCNLVFYHGTPQQSTSTTTVKHKSKQNCNLVFYHGTPQQSTSTTTVKHKSTQN